MRCMKFSGATKRTRSSSARGSARSSSGGTAGTKRQSSDPTNSLPPTLSVPTPPLTRHQHQLQIQQQQHSGGAGGGVNNSPHTLSSSSSSSAILNSIGPKPTQSESRMPGRHPHPPIGNNSKLKHKCPFDGCPWRFATPYKLRRHIKSHTKETPFVCKDCGRGFSVRYNLLMHIQTIHSQPQRFKCPMQGCKEAFHTQPRLNGHLRRVHKKDWKTLQPPKSEMEAKQNGSGTGGGSRSSSTSSDDSVDSAPKTQRFQCVQCSSVFSSQAKLNTHLKSHINSSTSSSSSDKSFKCTTQGCNKTFPSKDKLSKHLEIHKQTKQFCCPHENCNRVFLRQSHLKNHLKIHAHNYFVCPVMDCNEKFASEADYNVHLNSHMNYRHKCHVAGCGHAFLTRKRLELHCRVMHGLELQEPQPIFPVPPHLNPQPHHTPILTTVSTCPLTHNGSLLNVDDGIREVDLPGLSADEIETILSENSHWSGEQFKNFFHSAVELSELEAKLFSGSGYESDSGYSTYDVSPITSSAPLQFGSCHPEVPTSYRSISPALTPVNPSPYNISLSSSNHFQFGPAAIHSMPLHSSNGSATTPLPHSASPDGDFAFFPPTTPSYHHSPLPTALTPTQETAAYMMQGAAPQHNGFPPMQAPPTPTQQHHQRDFQMQSYAPILPIPDMRQHQQEDAYPIEFADILGENQASKTQVQSQCASGGEMQRRQQILSLPLLSPQNHQHSPDIKVEMECKPCMGGIEGTAITTPTTTSAVTQFPTQVKHEAGNSGSVPSCQMVSQLPPSASPQHNQTTTPPAQGTTSVTSSKHFKSFLTTCSKLPGLQELVSSGVHPSVIVVTISTALTAITANLPTHKLTVKEGPYDIPQLHSVIANLSPQQMEKLRDPTLITTAKSLATQHLEGLAKARKKKNDTKAATCSNTKSKSVAPQLTNNGIVVQNKTSVKMSLTVKAYPKHKSGCVGRVGATASDLKASHKKKTQWPRSMSKANLMAFREHILNKLKRGKEDGQTSSDSQDSSLSSSMSSASSTYEVDAGSDGEVPVQVRCSSEPADFFSHQMHSDSLPSPLQTSQSAGNISSMRSLNVKQQFDADFTQDGCSVHPDLKPDILLSSSVLGLPENILADMEIESLASMSSPSEHDFAQFLCDPSPPSSVTSPLDNMEDLDSIQDFLSGNSESAISSTQFTNTSSAAASSSTSMHSPSFTPTHSPTYTTANTAPQQDTNTFTILPCNQTPDQSNTPTCSMADVASLFNESINSITNVVESVPKTATQGTVTVEESLESVFQRPTDPLLACGSRLHW